MARDDKSKRAGELRDQGLTLDVIATRLNVSVPQASRLVKAAAALRHLSNADVLAGIGDEARWIIDDLKDDQVAVDAREMANKIGEANRRIQTDC